MISVPELPEPELSDPLGGALRWANAGWYVGPICAGKHPGSVLGRGWQTLTSRDPEVITTWFAGTGYQPFVHVGRSGAVVLDIDHPECTPQVLRDAVRALRPPFQSTRELEGLSAEEVLAAVDNCELRGHVFFACPPGRTIGNSAGGLGRDWGEVRGANGVVVVDPAVHTRPDGLYRVRRSGPLPMLPDSLSSLLPDAQANPGAATDAAVRHALNTWTGRSRPWALGGVVKVWDTRVRGQGASRHETLVSLACWGAREARAGLYPLRDALALLLGRWLDDTALPLGGGRVLTGAQARAEFWGAVSWAVGACLTASQERLDEIVEPDRHGDPLHCAPGAWGRLWTR